MTLIVGRLRTLGRVGLLLVVAVFLLIPALAQGQTEEGESRGEQVELNISGMFNIVFIGEAERILCCTALIEGSVVSIDGEVQADAEIFIDNLIQCNKIYHICNSNSVLYWCECDTLSSLQHEMIITANFISSAAIDIIFIFLYIGQYIKARGRPYASFNKEVG